jgi:hypothetical protein
MDFPKSHKGHDLSNLLDLGGTLLTDSFSLDQTDIVQIRLLNERYYKSAVYGNDDLRYASKTGTRKSPHPDNLNRIVKKMHKYAQKELLNFHG